MVFDYTYALKHLKMPDLARFLLWVSDFYLFVSKCLAAITSEREVYVFCLSRAVSDSFKEYIEEHTRKDANDAEKSEVVVGLPQPQPADHERKNGFHVFHRGNFGGLFDLKGFGHEKLADKAKNSNR